MAEKYLLRRMWRGGHIHSYLSTCYRYTVVGEHYRQISDIRRTLAIIQLIITHM